MMGFIYQGSNQLEALVEHISDLEKYRIPYRLRIDGLESGMDAGAEELAIGKVTVHSPEDPKAHMVEV